MTETVEWFDEPVTKALIDKISEQQKQVWRSEEVAARLHMAMWTNGNDLVVAASAEEAQQFLDAHLGFEEGIPMKWTILPGDEMFSISFDDQPSIHPIHQTVARWVAESVPGYFGSRDR